jgi:hypothetical protein
LGTFVVFSFILLQAYFIFVDHTYEYPWENEPFLVWNFHKPTPVFHLSMFGFPYFRHWEEIGEFVASSQNNGYYSTNERDSISRHHIFLKKSTDNAGFYVYVVSPQSFTDIIEKARIASWILANEPVKVYTDLRGRETVRIYYVR